jgi:aminotransferase
MLQVHQCSVTCVNGAAQYAAIAALKGPQDCIGAMVAEFARRRLLMYSRVNEIEGLKCALPQGAFYTFADIRQLKRDSASFSDYLFGKEKVFVVPGCAFGKAGEGFIRLSYSVAYGQIEEAMNRIEKAVKKL